jgi:hypothetical protein
LIASSYSFAYTFLDFLQELLSTLVARLVAILWLWRVIRSVTEGLKKQRLHGTSTIDDVELEELPDPFISLNQYCK